MTKPLLCVTVPARRRPTAPQRDGVSDADLVELRLDTVRDPDVAGALAGRHGPVIVTCRPTWEGGQLRGLRRGAPAIARAGARARRRVRRRRVARAVRRSDRPRPARIVLSMHDFDGMPADLLARRHAMRATNAQTSRSRPEPTPSATAPAARSRRAGRTRRPSGADRDGRLRRRDARARGTLRVGLDVRRAISTASGS